MRDQKLIQLLFIDCQSRFVTERELTRSLLRLKAGQAGRDDQLYASSYIQFLEGFFEGSSMPVREREKLPV